MFRLLISFQGNDKKKCRRINQHLGLVASGTAYEQRKNTTTMVYYYFPTLERAEKSRILIEKLEIVKVEIKS